MSLLPTYDIPKFAGWHADDDGYWYCKFDRPIPKELDVTFSFCTMEGNLWQIIWTDITGAEVSREQIEP